MPRAQITLEYQETPGAAADELSLADWGFEAESLEFHSLSESTLKLSLPLQDPTTPPVIPWEGWIVLRVGRIGSGKAWTQGKVIFQGYQTSCEFEAAGSKAAQVYTFQDSWYALQQLCYQQQVTSGKWTTWDTVTGRPSAGGVADTQDTWTSELALYQGPADEAHQLQIQKWTTGGQIADVIAYAKLQGVYIDGGINGFLSPNPLYTGPTTVEVNVNVPIHDVKEMMCGEVVQNAMKPTPDAVVYFQHDAGGLGAETGVPQFPPRLWVRYTDAGILTSSGSLSTGLPVVSLPYGNDGTPPWHMTTRLKARYELIPPVVWIDYRVTTVTDGVGWVTMVRDVYPNNGEGITGEYLSGTPATNPETGQPFTGRERGAVRQTIDLSGGNQTNFHGSLVCSSASADVFVTNAYPTTDNSVNQNRRSFWQRKQPQFVGANYNSGGVNSKYFNLLIGKGWIEDTNGVYGPVGADITTLITGGGGGFGAGAWFLESGQVQPWMTGVISLRATIKCACGYNEYGSSTDIANAVKPASVKAPPTAVMKAGPRDFS